jgi:hypothetical protein
MKSLQIGLDFGTYQTKACIYDTANDSHEFFQFTPGSFFIPSKVTFHIDQTFTYGGTSNNNEGINYYYFKIASAEDPEFHLQTFNENTSNAYSFEEFKPFTPTFLSTIYITYVLLDIKDKYKTGKSDNQLKGILGRFVGKQQEKKNVKFTTQLGIPTEWSYYKNLRRKRKFEMILLVSQYLQDTYKNTESFLKAKSSDLIKIVRDFYSSLKIITADDLSNTLNGSGLSVYSETAAGVNVYFKIKTVRSRILFHNGYWRWHNRYIIFPDNEKL